MDREIIEREEKIKRLCEKAEKVVEGKNSELANKVRLMMSWFKTSYNGMLKDFIDVIIDLIVACLKPAHHQSNLIYQLTVLSLSNKIYDYIDEVLEHPKDASEGFFLVAEIFEGFVNHGLNEFEQMIDLLRIENTSV
jgi:hypothetical protein